MSDVEHKILKMYDGSRPLDEDLYEVSHVNHLAWALVVILCGLLMWFGIALVNAENQRHALMTQRCVDPVFKGELDGHCLTLVRSREHWWQHLSYALTHVKPEGK